MKIERRIIDDLKTERADVTPSLPAYLRLVPILFYAVVLGGILLSAFFLLLLRNAAASQEEWKSETARRKQALADVQARRDSTERQVRRASDVVTWVQGARNLQPLVVAIIRSIEPGSSIVELGLTRDPATPAQIKLKLKLNTQGARQLDTILGEISSYNFRTYNPNQTQARGEVDYEATLFYQTARAPATTPSPSASQ
jgi:hypothetical protein